MSRSILMAWRPVALAALLALTAAPTNLWAAGRGGGYHGGGYHAGGYHTGGIHYGGYHAGGYRPGYVGGYHNVYGYNHRGYGYGYSGGYSAPWLYGSPAYISGGSNLPPDFYYSPDYTTTAPDYGLSADYTPDNTTPAPAGFVTAPTAVPDSTAGPAAVDVRVPGSAQIWVDGSPTQQTGEERQFTSPPLIPGQDYTYDVRARWTDNGNIVDETRRITVHANGMTLVDFTRPAQAASASK